MSLLILILTYVFGIITPFLITAVIFKYYLEKAKNEEVGQEASFGPHVVELRSDGEGKGEDSFPEPLLDNDNDFYKGGWVTVSREYFIYPSGGSKDTLKPPDQSANDLSLDKSTESAYSSLYKLMSSNRRGGGIGSNSVSAAASAVLSDAQTIFTSSNNDDGLNGGKKSKSSKLSKLFSVIQ